MGLFVIPDGVNRVLQAVVLSMSHVSAVEAAAAIPIESLFVLMAVSADVACYITDETRSKLEGIAFLRCLAVLK